MSQLMYDYVQRNRYRMYMKNHDSKTDALFFFAVIDWSSIDLLTQFYKYHNSPGTFFFFFLMLRYMAKVTVFTSRISH